jgi:beta-phosphoglucomutase
MALRAIVFDFDGVIANSEPLHFRAFHDVLHEEGVAFDKSEYYDRYLGFDDVGVFRTLGAERGMPWTLEDVIGLVARKAVRMESLEHDVSVLFPGAEDAIRRAAAVVPVAIASGALGMEIRRVLDRTHLTACFQAIVSAEDTLVSKPAPDPYLKAVALLSARVGEVLPSGSCVAIEDSHWGLESARAAGLRTVGVTNTYDAAALGIADLVIPSLDHLDLTLLEQLCAD